MLGSCCDAAPSHPAGSGGFPGQYTRSPGLIRGKVTSWLSKVFALNPAGLNWARAVMVLDVALVPLVVFWAIGHEVYLVSALFGLLFAVGLAA